MAEGLALYMEAFWRSPWDCSVYVALREKGLEFNTSIAMIREGIGAVDALRARTVTGTAPVLQHGSFWVAESMAIVDYLEEAFPPPHYPSLYPPGVRERARVRQVMAWVRTSLIALRDERPSEVIFYPRTEPWPPLSRAAQRNAERLIHVIEQLAAAGPWLFGDTFTIADVDLAFATHRLICSGEPVPDPVAAYCARVWARPSVRGYVDHPRPPNAPYD